MQSSNTPKIVGAFVVSAVLLIGAYVVLGSNSTVDDTTPSVAVSSQTEAASQDDTAAAELDDVEPEDDQATTDTEPEPAQASSDETATAEQAEAPAETSTYTDGTYTASTTYSVPHGDIEDISATVTISNDVVTSISVDTVATNAVSERWQAGFDELIVGEVEGQELDDADVVRLGGASLTSDAYNDILDAIRGSAQS